MTFRRQHIWLLLVTCLFASASNLEAATYYVRTDGNNANSGTGCDTTNAWATVAGAAKKSLSAGDIVYVQAGTYLGEIKPSVDGSSGSPIKFIADSNGSISDWPIGVVILQAPKKDKVLNLDNDDYLEFIGFQLDGDKKDDVVDIDNCAGTVLSKCQIYNGKKGIDLNSGELTLKNCLIRDNEDDGLRIDGGSVVVWNTTIVNNGSDGVQQDAGTSTIINSIVANNSSDGLDFNSGSMTHTYNLVFGSGDKDYEGTSASTGEITANPQFVGSSDYHLSSISPAIDAGTDASSLLGDDLEGLLRPAGGGWDMGSYEYNAIPSSDADGHWKLDETSGTLAADSSGNGNDGTYKNNPTLGLEAIKGTGAEFDGTAPHVQVPSSPFLDSIGQNNADFTVAYWMKLNQDATGRWRSIMHKGNADTQRTFAMWMVPGDNRLLYVISTTSNWNEYKYSTGTIPVGTWTHVAYVHANGTLNLYINGILDSSKTLKGQVVGNNGPIYIGKDPWYAGANAVLDDVRLYQRPLCASEVAELYGLLGHWKLDEISGFTAADSSPLGNDGSVIGTANWSTTCQGNGVFDFDGTIDSYITIPNSPALNPTDALSITAWVKGDAWSSSNVVNAILRKGEGNPNNYQLSIHDGHVSLHLDVNDNFGIQGDTVLDTGKWYHVGATWDGSEVRIYVNGVLDNTPASKTGPIPTDTRPLYIGGQAGTDRFDGMMYDVKLYNRALTASEFAQSAGLVGHYKLDETSGTVAIDSSGAANDGTFVSGPTLGVSGKINNAVEFDGSGPHVRVSNFPSLGQNNANFTVAYWMKLNQGATGSWRSIIHKGNTNFQRTFAMWMVPSDNRLLYVISTTASWNEYTYSTGTIPVGTWTHVAYVHANGTLNLYINGILDSSRTLSGQVVGNNGPLYIGKDPWFSGANAVLDDVRLYQQALCANEVNDLFNGGLPSGVRIIQWTEIR